MGLELTMNLLRVRRSSNTPHRPVYGALQLCTLYNLCVCITGLATGYSQLSSALNYGGVNRDPETVTINKYVLYREPIYSSTHAKCLVMQSFWILIILKTLIMSKKNKQRSLQLMQSI